MRTLKILGSYYGGFSTRSKKFNVPIMENYEKKYKEALERAKFLKENTDSVGAKDVSKCFEEIFPELKESEDERIRKEIIHLIKKSNEYGGYALHKDEADRMISWLEKQGRQTPTNKAEPKFKVGDFIVYNNNGVVAGAQWQKEQMINKACDWILNNFKCSGYSMPLYYKGVNYSPENIANDFKKAMEDEQ